MRLTALVIGSVVFPLVITVGSLMSPAWGGERTSPSREPTHTPEWTNPNESDPGIPGERPFSHGIRNAPMPGPAGDSVADDLQRIVVLCATEPQSAEFDLAWRQYLEEHYESDLDVDGLIEDVLLRAETHVAFGDGRRGSRPQAAFDRDETRLRMRQTAEELIPEIR